MKAFYHRAKFLLTHPEDLRHMLSLALSKAFSQRKALVQVIVDFLLLFRLVRAWLRGEYRSVPRKAILWAVLAILYFLSPLDLLPDIFPGSYIDDIAVIAYVCNRIREELEDFTSWERARKVV